MMRMVVVVVGWAVVLPPLLHRVGQRLQEHLLVTDGAESHEASSCAEDTHTDSEKATTQQNVSALPA